MWTKKKRWAVATVFIALSMAPLLQDSQLANAHMTCANMSHGHPVGVGWWAQKVGSGFFTYYDWYAANGPGPSVYQGRIQCPYA